MTGHWEMMGIKTKKPFITFTEHGFPPELITEPENRCCEIAREITLKDEWRVGRVIARPWK